jgi:hypothetical protein
MADHQGGFGDFDVRDTAQRDLARAARLRGQVQGAQGLQTGKALGLGHQHHTILIGLVENRRDDALTERIVQGIVDGGGSDAIARGELPVDLDIHAQALVVEIAGDVRNEAIFFIRAMSSGTYSWNDCWLGPRSTSWY